MENSVRPELVEGRTRFSLTQRVSLFWDVHASTFLTTNSPQQTPTTLIRVMGTNQAKSAKLMTLDSLTPISS